MYVELYIVIFFQSVQYGKEGKKKINWTVQKPDKHNLKLHNYDTFQNRKSHKKYFFQIEFIAFKHFLGSFWILWISL